MAHKGKSANPFILFGTMNKFSCLILPIYMLIMQVYHDSGPMRNFSHMPDSGWKTRLQSYARLQSEDMTPIVYTDFTWPC
jgi:hypothetical protein